MTKEPEITRFGHIRLTIQSDFTCDTGKTQYNEPETMLFTTLNNDEIKSIVLEDKTYHKLVVRILEQYIAEYKRKYLY